MKFYSFLALVILALSPLVSSAQPIVAASNDFDSPVNLTNTVITVDNPFTSAGDIFDVTSTAPPVPFALVDDTNPACPGFFANDTQGAVACAYPGNFFGMVDTENGNNMGAVTAEWTFDISSVSFLSSISIDMAAMGDFEVSNDIFTWSYSIDGGPFITAFEMIPNEAISANYTLFDGDVFTLNDPMEVNGGLVINEFQTFSTGINGTGSTLVLRLEGMGDGGSEALAWDNIVIMGLAPGAAIPTMGQWATFLFALIMLSFGLVFVYKAQNRLAVAGGASVSANNQVVPFDQTIFQSALKTAMLLALPGFALIYMVWGEVISTDFIGMAMAIPTVAYLIHMVKLFGKK